MEKMSCKRKLIEKARSKYKEHEILPCGNFSKLEECFTSVGNRLIFWFNTSGDNSTRMVDMVIS